MFFFLLPSALSRDSLFDRAARRPRGIMPFYFSMIDAAFNTKGLRKIRGCFSFVSMVRNVVWGQRLYTGSIIVMLFVFMTENFLKYFFYQEIVFSNQIENS